MSIVALAFASAPQSTVRAATLHIIPAVPKAVENGDATKLGPEPLGNTAQISIVLPLRDSAGLQQFLAGVNNPSAPNFHQYLTQDEANQAFNPSAADEQRVISWLQNAGLSIVQTYANRLMVTASGTVGQINQLLHISLQEYQGKVRGHDTRFRAPSSDPTIDASISNVVSTVVGLDTYPRFWHASNGIAHGSTPYYPQDFANAYNVNPLWNAGYTGAGQHIGITLWTKPPADSTLTAFANKTGATAFTTANGRLKVIKVDGGTTTIDDGEAGMDIESSAGLAPGAVIDYYEAPTDSSGNPTDQGLLDALNLAGTDANNNQQITNSWGGCEASSSSDPWTKGAENIFAANSATGHSYFFSSGDNGSACDATTPGIFQDPYPDYPASSPNVVSVGGTRFSNAVGSAYPGEATWTYAAGTAPEGSGGGFSLIFSRPAWQFNTGLPASGGRAYPDISADADPATGALVYYGDSSTAAQIGGTSLSSPLWAGISALLNQYMKAKQGKSIGNLNATLYTMASVPQQFSAFHDITSGTNGQYNAHSAWDAVSGLGTPDVWNLARDIAGTPAASATISASPNPVAAASSSTTITWNTGDGSTGQVWVSLNGSAQSLFAQGPSGSAGAPWISAAGSYMFTLYSGTSHTTSLTSVTVTKATPASISASPNPVTVSSGVGSTTVMWSTGNGTTGQVWVSVNGAADVLVAQGSGASTAIPWIAYGASYAFTLYAGTSHASVLASTTVTTSSPATLSALPNPVTCSATGSTSVSWNTGDASVGQVWVSVNGGTEILFAQSSGGSAPAPWISQGSTYSFKLYAGLTHTTVLRTASVACG